MTRPNLTPYASVQSNLFVRIQVDEYRTSAGAEYTEEILRFSDLLIPYIINEEEYLGLGKFMAITSTSSEIRVSSTQLTITLSGIPTNAISEVVNSKIKGCPVEVYRVLFDPATGAKLDIEGNPVGRFRGFINNYSIQEEFDNSSKTASNTLVLTCASSIDVLANKVGGRKTNPSSMKKFYPDDVSFDRVPNLENTTFNFGAPL
jgi:hypothetical protein